MQILDSSLTPPPSQPIWKTASLFGLGQGIALVVIAQCLFYWGPGPITVPGQMLHLACLSTLSMATSYFAIRWQRDRLDGGYILWPKSFGVCSLSLLIGILVLDLWNYFFINYIRPDYLSALKQQMVDVWSAKVPPETLSAMSAHLEEMRELGHLLQNSLMLETPVCLLSGALVSLFMVRKFSH